ncbi:hypothetical protein ACC695_39765, partial [Rhizobium ruizarguesonis]
EMGVEVFHSMQEGLKDADVVMMLRLQRERMSGAFVPSVREYFHFYGLDSHLGDAGRQESRGRDDTHEGAHRVEQQDIGARHPR